MVGKRTFTNGEVPDGANGDLESGRRYPGGFKDAVSAAMLDRKRFEISDKLKAGIRQDEFEHYRTAQEKVSFCLGRGVGESRG